MGLEDKQVARRLEIWKRDWVKIVQVKKTVRKTGGYTLTVMVNPSHNDDAVEILKAIATLLRE